MLEIIKNITNIIFFSIVSIVTVLSYLQARKTLFSPIRTEIFKLQLKEFEKLIEYFQNKTEHDFLNLFDYHRICELNIKQMEYSYIENFFPNEISIDKEKKQKIMASITGRIVSEKFLKKDDLLAFYDREEKKTSLNPDEILENWRKYEHEEIVYTQEYIVQLRNLEHISASPIFPQKLQKLIVDFIRAVNHDMFIIGPIIEKCSQAMLEKYPNSKAIINFSPDWIINEIIQERKELEPVANEILLFINQYLNVEKIMNV